MKSYHLVSFDSLDALQIAEHPIPVPGPCDVLIRVMANSLNFRDIAIATGKYGGPQLKPGVVPLSDGAGVVLAIGADVKGYAPGDRVIGVFRQNWQGGTMPLRAVHSDLGGSRDGMLRELVALNEEAICKLPDYLSWAEAATLPCAALTAWNALTVGGTVEPGQSVLVLGSGGVSLFALQFAKRFGARVIATTSNPAKAEKLRALGADAVINYREVPDWGDAVRAATDGHGVDRVIETGGSGTLQQSITAAAVQARIVLIGVLAAEGRIDPQPILLKRLALQAISTGSREMLEQMLRAMQAWDIHPVIDQSFPFEGARAAYEYLQGGTHFGKVIIERSYDASV